jgi:hypothetical protein
MTLKLPAGHPAGFTVFSKLEVFFLRLFGTEEIISVVFCRNNLVSVLIPFISKIEDIFCVVLAGITSLTYLSCSSGRGWQKTDFVNALILFVRVKENA